MARFGAPFGRQESVFDPHERGAFNNDPTLSALEPLPPDPRRTSVRKLLLYFAIGVIAIGLLRDGVGKDAPAVSGSCTVPAFSLDKSDVKSNGVLTWSATGPSDADLVIGVDTETVPETFEQGKLAGPIPLKDCKAEGRFGVRAPEGDHTLTAFLVATDGSSRRVTTQKIVVSAP